MSGFYPFNPNLGQKIQGSDGKGSLDQAFIAHLHADPALGATNAVHAAIPCTTIAIAAACVVKAASAVTDILTTSLPASIGAAGNALKILLTTAEDDVLAVTKTEATKTINISLAKTTAANNAAAAIQVAIRALGTVGGVSVAAATCAAGGNWDTAAVATGEAAAVAFAGGQTEAADVVVTGFTNPDVPRNITATAGGTAGDIKAVQVIVEGTNAAGEVITETLPAFTVNTQGTVVGSKAFKTVTKITVPAHDGTGATTAIGTGAKLGLSHKLAHNTVLKTYQNNTEEGNAPTVAVSATALESNTAALSTALDGNAVDLYYLV